MYYPNKRKRVDGVNPLYPTYCENEERQYFQKENISSSYKQATILLFMSLVFLFIGIFTSGEAIPYKKTFQECQWDGAGDTWTCGNCGKSNYKWQMSCTNCGTRQ